MTSAWEYEDGEEPFDPETSDISFSRRKSGGKVHVIVPLLVGDDQVGETGLSLGFFTSVMRIRTLCGRLLSWSDYYGVSAFPDEKLCMACHAVMGEHSDRLFEHPTAYQ